jgi:hypothetical protein
MMIVSCRANCKWVYQKLDSRFRGNDIALQLFSVMPAQAGIQDLLLLRVNANEIRSNVTLPAALSLLASLWYQSLR